jgi:hypothetical protein
MILPDKYISEKQSLLHLGGVIISLLAKPTTISRLWDIAKDKGHIYSFEHFILTLDMLFMIDAIKLKNDKIELERKQ